MKKRIPAAALSLALALSLAAPASALEVEDARKLLEEHYVDPIPAAALEAESVDEMLRLLGDPYTVYYTAEEYAAFLSAVNGETLVGIGVSLQTAFDNGFEILSILPDSPALEAGLQPGDTILAVDGITLTAQDSASAHITGEEGTPVTLTIRTQEGEIRDVTMVRRTVQVPIVAHEQIGSAGYIDCSSFGASAPNDVRDALLELDASTAVWLMDLRSNPGGTSEAAAGAAGRFLGRNLMVYFRSADDTYYQTSTTALSPDMTDKPLIILTSSQSASASELFAAAIRDHRGGISVGQRTYGKGIAQHAFDQDTHPELFDGDALKVTVYRFFSPDGATNHVVGVIPTLLISSGNAESAALMLSAPAPERSLKNLKLELCGQTFYLDLALCQADPDALSELLEALPPDARLYSGTGGSYWREVSAAEVAQRFGLDHQPRAFSDLEGHPYQREINTLYTYDLVAGLDDGLFHPERELSRAELAAILASALDLPVPDAAPAFSDVPDWAWYADSVAAITALGFMSGTGEGTFSPNATLTNQELYTVYSAVAAWCSMEGYALSKKDVSAVQWVDVYYYPEWAQGPARNMMELGLDIDLDAPSAAVTRGTAAGMLCRLLENIHMLWNN